MRKPSDDALRDITYLLAGLTPPDISSGFAFRDEFGGILVPKYLAVNPAQSYMEDNSAVPVNGAPTGGGSGVVRGGIFSNAFTLPTLIGSEVFDSASLLCFGVKKVIWIIVQTAAVVYAASGQATIQFFATRQAVAAAAVASSAVSLITAPNFKQSLGAAQNLGASGLNLPIGQYRFGPEIAALAGLLSPDLQLGFEILFPGGNVASGGPLTAELEHGSV